MTGKSSPLLARADSSALPYLTCPREQLDWTIGYVEELCWRAVGRGDTTAISVEEFLFILEQLRALKRMTAKVGDLDENRFAGS
jgi:hypothetical protein